MKDDSFKNNDPFLKKLQVVDMQFPNAELLPEIIKLLEEGHNVALQLRGISMRPFLEDMRDKALLTRAKDPQVGDPVLAEISPKRYVLHRIIRIDGSQVTLRGDGNLNTETCQLGDVRASVIGFYRKGRKQMDKTDGWKWKLYSAIWTRLFPIRRYLLAIYRRVFIR